jgi:cysteinyl-tRNA synthetase
MELLNTVDELLGLQLVDGTPDITDNQKRLILERERVREAKDWTKSDVLRDELLAEGVSVKDTKFGAVWSYA